MDQEDLLGPKGPGRENDRSHSPVSEMHGARALCCQCPLGVITDKTHCEHNESAFTPTAERLEATKCFLRVFREIAQPLLNRFRLLAVLQPRGKTEVPNLRLGAPRGADCSRMEIPLAGGQFREQQWR
jgi:hypothetical protein